MEAKIVVLEHDSAEFKRQIENNIKKGYDVVPGTVVFANHAPRYFCVMEHAELMARQQMEMMNKLGIDLHEDAD